MNPLEILFIKYSFGHFIGELLRQIGITGILLIATGLLGTYAYFVAKPMRGQFSSMEQKSGIFSFIQQLVYIFTIIPILLFIWIEPNYFGTFLLTYLPLVSVSLFTVLFFPKINYKSLIKFKQKGFLKAIPTKEMASVSFLWISIMAVTYLLAVYNPIQPLIGWIMLSYTLIYMSFQAAFVHGLLLQFQQALYADITIVDDKSLKGFIIGKGEDHLIVLNENEEIIIMSSQVKDIRPVEIPKKSLKNISNNS